jgi:hypothetical protein
LTRLAHGTFEEPFDVGVDGDGGPHIVIIASQKAAVKMFLGYAGGPPANDGAKWGNAKTLRGQKAQRGF